MKLTRVQAQRILDKIDVQSNFPWKHELNYLRETIDAVFDEADVLLDQRDSLQREVDSLKEETHPCGYGYVEEGDW